MLNANAGNPSNNSFRYGETMALNRNLRNMILRNSESRIGCSMF